VIRVFALTLFFFFVAISIKPDIMTIGNITNQD